MKRIYSIKTSFIHNFEIRILGMLEKLLQKWRRLKVCMTKPQHIDAFHRNPNRRAFEFKAELFSLLVHHFSVLACNFKHFFHKRVTVIFETNSTRFALGLISLLNSWHAFLRRYQRLSRCY